MFRSDLDWCTSQLIDFSYVYDRNRDFLCQLQNIAQRHESLCVLS